MEDFSDVILLLKSWNFVLLYLMPTYLLLLWLHLQYFQIYCSPEGAWTNQSQVIIVEKSMMAYQEIDHQEVCDYN